MPVYESLSLGDDGQYQPLNRQQIEAAGELISLARRVAVLAARPGAMDRFRAQVRQWRAELDPSSPSLWPPPLRVLTLPESYTLMAAIHDACRAGNEPIDPWASQRELHHEDWKWIAEAMAYTALRLNILPKDGCRHVAEQHRDALQAIMADVEADLPKAPQKRRGGGRKADPKQVQREAKLKADWERAKASGVRKIDFAKENGFRTEKEFQRVLVNVAKRKERADKAL